MWKKLLFTLSIFAGLAAFCAIPFIVGIDKTKSALEQAGILCIIVYFLVCTATWIFPGIGWWILLRAEGVKVSIFAPIRGKSRWPCIRTLR